MGVSEDVEKVLSKYRLFSLDDSSCFLCGSSDSLTREHVFPKWLQKAHSLWDKKIYLLNKTQITYRSLTIPCCQRCNGVYLSKLESKVNSSLQAGFDAANQISPFEWYLWGAKILYGQLRKECSLPIDRANKDQGSIMNREHLTKYFFMIHLSLQAIREKVYFSSDSARHFSVIVLKINNHDDSQFDYRDNTFCCTSSIIVNGVGIIIAYEDNSLVESLFEKEIQEFTNKGITFRQFRELYGNINYVCYRQSTPTYVYSCDVNGEREMSIECYGGNHLSEYSPELHLSFLLESLGEFFTEKQIEEFLNTKTIPSFMYDSDWNII